MNRVNLITLILFLFASTAAAQEEDIVKIIDDLTIEWDNGAEKLSTYEGLKEYCRVKPYRDRTIKLLNNIHHYDTVLFQIVTEKFEMEKDPEAKATIDDIETLEVDYTTKSFLVFLREECQESNFIENNLGRAGGEEYKQEVAALEEELKKYIDAITRQIDLIDDHVHHLNGL